MRHPYITDIRREAIEEGRKEEAVELLTTMQEVIIMLGNKTEQFYGESKRVSEFIALLEECCELIWKCANVEISESLNVYSVLERQLYKSYQGLEKF